MRLAPYAFFLTLVACGGRTLPGSPTAAPGPDASASAIAACNAEVAANCVRFESCDVDDFSSQYSNLEGCEARRNVACLASLAASDTASSPATVMACATATATESCESLLNGDPIPSACASPAGPRAVGSNCTYGGQCSTGFCAVPAASACGTCREPLTAGASCAGLVSCGPKLWCYQQVCVASAANGEVCSALQPCMVGLACVIPTGAEAGTCQAEASAVGAACVRRDLTVNPGAGCDPTKGLTCYTDGNGNSACQAIETATAGETCNTVDFVETAPDVVTCVAGSVCTLQSPGNAICVARVADGASCNSLTGPFCQPLSRCLGTTLDGGALGTCVAPGTATCP